LNNGLNEELLAGGANRVARHRRFRRKAKEEANASAGAERKAKTGSLDTSADVELGTAFKPTRGEIHLTKDGSHLSLLETWWWFARRIVYHTRRSRLTVRLLGEVPRTEELLDWWQP